jgi:hypothetical protein
MLVIDSFDRGVSRSPAGTCFITADDPERMSYREVASLPHRIAAALAAAG